MLKAQPRACLWPSTTGLDVTNLVNIMGEKNREFATMATVTRDRMLWIPVASVGAFMAAILIPGLLSFICPAGFTARMNSILAYRPFKPGRKRWWDAPTVDLIPALRDMQVADFLISSLWLLANILMMLSPQGDKVGRICVVAWATLLLPITKHSIWALIMGSTFERYLKFHRWSARAATVFTIAHIGQQVGRRGVVRAFVGWKPSTTMYGVVWGTVAFGIMGGIFILSIEPIRRRYFELFYYSHFLALPAVAFAMMHSYAQCYAMIPPLALYLIDKAIQLWSTVRTFQIQSVMPVAGGAQLVLHRKGAKLPSEPGQYYFLTLPTISWLQKHPMSVTLFSAKDDTLTFFIRDMGPGTFSHQVCQTAFPPTATAQLTGPYGSLSLPRPLHVYRTVYLIGGGVGVTPMVSAAQELVQLAQPRPKVHFIWLSRDATAFFEWFPAVLLELQRCEGFELSLYHTSRAPVPTPAPAAAAPTPAPATATQAATAAVKSNPLAAIDITASTSTPAAVDGVAHQAVVLELKGAMEVHSDESDSKDDTASTHSSSVAVTLEKPKPTGLEAAIISGRPDWTGVFAPNVAEGSNVAVMTCGPEALVAEVQRLAHTHRFHFHKETFLF